MYMFVVTVHLGVLVDLQTAVVIISLSLSLSLSLQPGFEIDAELLNGRNALHYAADYGQADVIKFLVSKKAKLDVS